MKSELKPNIRIIKNMIKGVSAGRLDNKSIWNLAIDMLRYFNNFTRPDSGVDVKLPKEKELDRTMPESELKLKLQKFFGIQGDIVKDYFYFNLNTLINEIETTYPQLDVKWPEEQSSGKFKSGKLIESDYEQGWNHCLNACINAYTEMKERL